MKISEVFRSISGEGITQGYKTIFVRTIGCNLNCAWCDTNYAKKGGEEWDIGQVVEKIESFQPIRHVFFTGGEPLLHHQDIESVIDLLAPLGYFFTVKTNGAMPVAPLMSIRPQVSFAVDVKTPSSEMHEKMCFENFMVLRETDELLYACADKNDWQYAVDHHRHILSQYNCKAQPCFSPVWEVSALDNPCITVAQPWWQEMAELMIASGPSNAKYSLQLHKCVWGPTKKGV